MGNQILLFDIDGVLLKPGGYQAALMDTLLYFYRKMNLSEQVLPGHDVIALFESLGITCEWDQVAICLALVLDELGKQNNHILPAGNISAALVWGSLQAQITQMDYKTHINKLSAYLKDGQAVVEAILGAAHRKELRNLFENLSLELLESCFGDTRNVLGCYTTRIFQNFVLGNEKFEGIYGQQAELLSKSYLQEFDQPIINRDWVNYLAGTRNSGLNHIAAYTARYSLPPIAKDGYWKDYSPEAEIALGVVGLEMLPLVAYGSLHYLATRVGFTGERLVKPVPVQALAAIASACGVPVWDALQWAYCLVAGRGAYADLPPLLSNLNQIEVDIPDCFEIHVFEDSPIGIRACVGAAEILQSSGRQVSLNAWGISPHPVKKQALQAVGATVFDDINQALPHIFKTL